MGESDNIAIHKMIVHKVDQKKYAEPLLSDMLSPISEDVDLFLKTHIKQNIEHKYTREAIFVDSVEDDAEDILTEEADDEDITNGHVSLKDICDDLLCNTDNTDHFITQSRAVACQLFNAIDGRVSSGDLVIFTYSEEDDGHNRLALLKMDPQDGFVGETETIDNQVRIVLKRVPEILPTGALQKCAFILPQNLREVHGYDLKVLDRQASRFGIQRLVASFFVTGFLQCRVGLSREDRTRVFIYGSYEWANNQKWTVEERERFKRHVAESIENSILDVTEFAQANIADHNEQDDYLKYMLNKGLRELTFEPDPNERQRLTEYVSYEGDDDLRIDIRSDAVGKTLNAEKDPSTNTWNISIRTTRWEKKVKRGRK